MTVDRDQPRRSSSPPWRRPRRTSGAAYLDEACGGRRGAAPAGRGAAARPTTSAGSFLEQPGRELGRDRRLSRPLAKRPGTVIGPYKLLQQIGEGGMGVVFMAEQTEPVRRKVALKVIKPGMDTPAGHRPLRGRAAGPGADGPSQHRPGARRRHHRQPAGRTSSWSWSRACRSPSTATSNQLTPAAAAGAVRAGLPGGPARPPEGHHPPRHQAVQRPGRALRRQAGAQGDRLRRGQGDRAAADRARRCSRSSARWSARPST